MTAADDLLRALLAPTSEPPCAACNSPAGSVCSRHRPVAPTSEPGERESNADKLPPCDCGTPIPRHAPGTHEGCEYCEHHCTTCHRDRACTKTECGFAVAPASHEPTPAVDCDECGNTGYYYHDDVCYPCSCNWGQKTHVRASAPPSVPATPPELRSLSDEELAKLPIITSEQIEAAIAAGRADREKFERGANLRVTPSVPATAVSDDGVMALRALRIIEEMTCHDNMGETPEEKMLNEVYRLAHYVNSPDCRKNHPTWGDDIRDAAGDGNGT